MVGSGAAVEATESGVFRVGRRRRIISSPSHVSIKAIDLTFILSIVFIAFNATLSLSFLGEVGTEPYVLFNLFVAPFTVLSLIYRGLLRKSPQLFWFAAIFFLVVMLSIGANLSYVISNQWRDRSGLGRVFTTTLVPIFGFYFAYLTETYARADVYRLVAVPLLLSAILVVAFGDIELLSWASDGFYNSFIGFWTVLHNALDHVSKSERIQSVTTEASNFGMYAIFIMPFLWVFCGYSKTIVGRIVSAFLIVDIFGLSLLSGRTSFFGVIIINLIFFYIVLLIKAAARGSGYLRITVLAAFLVTSFLPVLLIANYKNEIAMLIVASSNGEVSNLSRFGTMAIQTDIFIENPIFGVGMGQYPFYVPSHMFSWADTWEFKRWISSPKASFFPSFSIYTRVAAELGIFGYVVWVAFSYYFLKMALKAAVDFKRSSGQTPLVGIAIICGFFGMQLMGWNIASYKVPYIWAVFGLAAAYWKAPRVLEYLPTASARVQRLKRNSTVGPRIRDVPNL
jgi:hypothetical protein